MPQGPWNDRVRFSREGTPYVPGVIAVDAADGEQGVRDALITVLSLIGIDDPADRYIVEQIFGSWYRITLSANDDPAVFADLFREQSQISAAQVIHVLFGHDVKGSPFFASPFFASPFFASPFFASPFASPFFASPFFASPFFASPWAIPNVQLDGVQPSSARPVPSTGRNAPPQGKGYGGARVAVLDTGWIANAHAHLQGMVQPTVHDTSAIANNAGISLIQMPIDRLDVPDGTGDGYLDPITGHATFIAGIIERHAPGTRLDIWPVLTEFGDGREDDIATVLFSLADKANRPDVVNLSFGAYLFDGPAGGKLSQVGLLESAIKALQQLGTIVVASAGNDGSFAPTYPAALDGVVGVGAVDGNGNPAPFSNHGPWVRACSFGVDVISLFFDDFPLRANDFYGVDPKAFVGWASWSGTSFAAPHVTAAFAREIAAQGPMSGPKAANKLVESLLGPDTAPTRLAGLGTLVQND